MGAGLVAVQVVLVVETTLLGHLEVITNRSLREEGLLGVVSAHFERHLVKYLLRKVQPALALDLLINHLDECMHIVVNVLLLIDQVMCFLLFLDSGLLGADLVSNLLLLGRGQALLSQLFLQFCDFLL